MALHNIESPLSRDLNGDLSDKPYNFLSFYIELN